MLFFLQGPMYDNHGGDNDDEYDKTRRISLTQAYRRNTTVRPPVSSMTGQRRIAINNGNHPIYKVRHPHPLKKTKLINHNHLDSLRYKYA